jgi:hypothetical protein
VSFQKFHKSDVFHNQVKTYPQIRFVIYSGSIYYNNKVSQDALGISGGSISLYELNHNLSVSPIYPFITKAGSLTSFRTVSLNNFNQFKYGDIISGSYPLSATIVREYGTNNSILQKRIKALKNTINFYSPLSQYYGFSFYEAPVDVNLISVPSIFYGSSIKKGSVDLKFYITGTLVGQAQDVKQNGELVQVGPPGSVGSGSVAGIVLYNEGFVLLTGSWDLSDGLHTEAYDPGSNVAPSWKYFASTGSSTIGVSATHTAVPNSSFDLQFKGTNTIPTLTMFAHARKGELNHSNNPTYAAHGQELLAGAVTGTYSYKEYDEGTIKNTVKSPYSDPTGSFEKIVYISKIGVYDDQRNLIAIAKLATPVKKTEGREFTFKLKLDI